MISASIYYFSATGNSYAAALEISRGIPGSCLVSIAAALRQERVTETAPVVGFVFPVYFQDIPYPVRALIQKICFDENARPYLFICSTSRGYPGTAIGKRMQQLLAAKGEKLSLALTIPMPGNSRMNTPEEDARYLAQYQALAQKAAKAVMERRIRHYESDETFPETPTVRPNNFRGLRADESCTGCGRCTAVCVMENIVICGGKAVIGDNCVNCLACFHWCPVQAIEMTRNADNGRRPQYHHPRVTFWDLVIPQDA